MIPLAGTEVEKKQHRKPVIADVSIDWDNVKVNKARPTQLGNGFLVMVLIF